MIENITFVLCNGWHDRLTSFNDGSITYDAIGNPLSYYNGNFYTFTWKNGRELATAQKGYTSVAYQYGADGLRTKKTVDGWDYNYYYSDGKLVRQTWADGETIDFLYDESGLPYSFIYNGTQYYYIKNLQNDVIAIVNTSGNIVVEYEYDDWGDVYASGSMASTVGAVNPIRYRSYYYDTETRFYYLESRYYDPAIRRFINADGYINANGDFIGFNMYAYCGNNPVNCADYNGKDAIYVTDHNYSNFLIQATGHAILYFQNENGDWYITEFTGTKKSNATVKLTDTSPRNDSRLNEMLLSKDINGVSYVMIKGDFSNCYDLANIYKCAVPNYGGYNLTSNNCLHYVQEILCEGTFENPNMRLCVQEKCIIPAMYSEKLKKEESRTYPTSIPMPWIDESPMKTTATGINLPR